MAKALSRFSIERDGAGFIPVVFWGMVIVFVLLSMARRGQGRRYRQQGKGRRGRRRSGFDAGDAAIILWGLSNLGGRSRGGWGGGGFGGGGGGGFGGFSGGGGSFGGGGASGSW